MRNDDDDDAAARDTIAIDAPPTKTRIRLATGV
jgi:hypothetical protein